MIPNYLFLIIKLISFRYSEEIEIYILYIFCSPCKSSCPRARRFSASGTCTSTRVRPSLFTSTWLVRMILTLTDPLSLIMKPGGCARASAHCSALQLTSSAESAWCTLRSTLTVSFGFRDAKFPWSGDYRCMTRRLFLSCCTIVVAGQHPSMLWRNSILATASTWGLSLTLPGRKESLAM